MSTCGKGLTDKLVEEYSENVAGNEMIYNGTLNDHKKHAVLVQYRFIISHIFHNKYKHYQCFYLHSLILIEE